MCRVLLGARARPDPGRGGGRVGLKLPPSTNAPPRSAVAGEMQSCRSVQDGLP